MFTKSLTDTHKQFKASSSSEYPVIYGKTTEDVKKEIRAPDSTQKHAALLKLYFLK